MRANLSSGPSHAPVAKKTGDAPTSPRAFLVPISGPTMPPIELIDKPGGFTLGRHEECDAPLPADAEGVSRFHARFERRDGSWRVIDLGSRWGTYVNGVKAQPNTDLPLQDGDLLRISPWTFSLSPVAHKRGMSAEEDSGSTMIRTVTTDRARPLAEDMLALLLESAASIHAAADEKQLAETLMDGACRGTGLMNAALLRPIDAGSGHFDIIASRSSPGSTSDSSSRASFSRSLIKAASNGVVAELSGGGGNNVSASIVQMKISSAICVPLMLGNAVAAYLYLDSRGTLMQSLRPNASAFCVALGRIASLALANLKRIDMEKREERLRADLSAAATAQKWIMPKRESHHGVFTCTGESRAGQFVGGDFFDIIPLPDSRLAIALGDVSGKGITASVLMTATQGFLHACLLQNGDDLGKVVTNLNRFISPRRPENKFVTMWVGVLDAARQTVHYIDAGHSYATVRHADGTFEQFDHGGGLPLGLDDSFEYVAETARIAAGDELVVVSDGLIEQYGFVQKDDGTAAGKIEREQFELAGVQQAIAAGDADRVAAIFNAIIAHAGTSQLSDDATAVHVAWPQ